MSIKLLNENISKSKYNKIFTSKTLESKYISFFEIELGNYFATLKLYRLQKSKEGIDEKEVNYEKNIIEIQEHIYEKEYENKLISLINLENFSELEIKILKIIFLKNDIILIGLNDIEDKSLIKGSLENLCNYYGTSRQSFYLYNKKILSKLIKLMEKN